METKDSVHQVQIGVFRFHEFNATAKNELSCSQTVEPKIDGIKDGVDLPTGNREIKTGPIVLNQDVSDPSEHSFYRDKRIFRVSSCRIDGGSVAPALPATDKVQSRNDAVSVEVCRFGLGEENFCSLPPELVDRFKKEYKKAEVLIGMKDGGYFTLSVPAKPKLKDNKSHEKNHSSPER